MNNKFLKIMYKQILLQNIVNNNEIDTLNSNNVTNINNNISINFKRLFKEVEDVNNDFYNLRTKISTTDLVNEFNFIMFPNDGSLSHLPLIGKMYIPKNYPIDPPILHLYSRTFRCNVDIYRGASKKYSSMCFDILKKRENGGTWHPHHTLSALFATLMQGIVSYNVDQEYGAPKCEAVSMEKLREIHENNLNTFNVCMKRMNNSLDLPKIPVVEPDIIDGIYLEEFPKIIRSYTNTKGLYIYSDPFKINEINSSYILGVDLSNLKDNFIFSVILINSNNPDDISDNINGLKDETILIRNGVTGTAAIKKYNKNIEWFFHGLPLNQNNTKIYITITKSQFTISYEHKYTENKIFINGDTSVSHIDYKSLNLQNEDELNNMDFYLCLFLRNKDRNNNKPIILNTFNPNYGYIQSPNCKIFQKKHNYIS